MITQVGLFGNTVVDVPKTEGIKYAGSKLKLIPSIIDVVQELKVDHIFDGFSGTSRVSQAFAKIGYRVTSNDISDWSYVFGQCFLKSSKLKIKNYSEIIKHLNNCKPIENWFSSMYGGDSLSVEKRPFQAKNAQKAAAIRNEIDVMGLSNDEKYMALTSLILALDSVDSTLGHYVSYLAEWSPRSYNDMVLKIPSIVGKREDEHQILKGDVFESITEKEFDLAYFDPPYGSNNEKMPSSRVRYASYYHIWTTLIRNDNPIVFGKVNRREDTRDLIAGSVFEEFRKNENGHYIAMCAIGDLLSKVNSKYILLSYSSGGRATKEELYEIINKSGRLLKAIEIDYKKNVMGNMRWTNEWINSDGKYHEYLFLIQKTA